MRDAPVLGALIGMLAAVARVTVVPVFEATVLHRPWIEASSERPRETLVYRANGRYDVADTVAEIADALARGEERPAPLGAAWVGRSGGRVL